MSRVASLITCPAQRRTKRPTASFPFPPLPPYRRYPASFPSPRVPSVATGGQTRCCQPSKLGGTSGLTPAASIATLPPPVASLPQPVAALPLPVAALPAARRPAGVCGRADGGHCRWQLGRRKQITTKKGRHSSSVSLRGRLPTLPLSQYHRRGEA